MPNAYTRRVIALLLALLAAVTTSGGVTAAPTATQAAGPRARQSARFSVEEATIADVHRAIQRGDTTCRAIVETYIARARAYDGACVQLVTKDGAAIPRATGTVRAGAPVAFRTTTTAVSSVLPNVSEYIG